MNRSAESKTEELKSFYHRLLLVQLLTWSREQSFYQLAIIRREYKFHDYNELK